MQWWAISELFAYCYLHTRDVKTTTLKVQFRSAIADLKDV